MTRKNSILIVIAALFVAGVFFATEYRNKNAEKELYQATDAITVSTSTETGLISYSNDSDGDGLKDWEEALWGTDPKNQDTDVDGTTDSREVELGRSPVVKKTKTTDDRLSVLTATSTKNTSITLSETDRLGRDIFARYLALKEAGLGNDTESINQLVQQITSGDTLNKSQKIYSDQDINIGNLNTLEAIRAYGNNIGFIFNTYSIKSRSEVIIAQEAIQKNEPFILNELDPIISSYKNILKGLIGTQVPPSMSFLHKDLVNAMSEVLFVTEAIKKSISDPVIGIQGINKYTDAMKNFHAAFNAIRNYYTTGGVKFTSNEAGWILTK